MSLRLPSPPLTHSPLLAPPSLISASRLFQFSIVRFATSAGADPPSLTNVWIILATSGVSAYAVGTVSYTHLTLPTTPYV